MSNNKDLLTYLLTYSIRAVAIRVKGGNMNVCSGLHAASRLRRHCMDALRAGHIG